MKKLIEFLSCILFWVIVAVFIPIRWVVVLFRPGTWELLAEMSKTMCKYNAAKKSEKEVSINLSDRAAAVQEFSWRFFHSFWLWVIIAALSYTVWFK